MKKLLLLVFVLLNVQAYAAVGKHNLSVRAGGGLSVSELKLLNKIDGQTMPEEIIKNSKQKLLGGMFEINLGYQFFEVTSSSFVHGVNVLAGFGMNFDTLQSVGGQKLNDPDFTANNNRMYGSLSSTYSVGHQFSNAKLMFDILGLNLTFGNFNQEIICKFNGSVEKQSIPVGGYFGVGINLPLGIQYVMNNGFVIGFNHSLNFLLPTYQKDRVNILQLSNTKIRAFDFINYSLAFSVGFMFGK